MIGGEEAIVNHLDPIFRSLAPGVGSAARTPGRTGEPSTSENGYLRCGQNGAGHFVKMVHNGIEYGIMAAFAEGLNIIKNANAGKVKREEDAETTPLAILSCINMTWTCPMSRRSGGAAVLSVPGCLI